MCFSQAGIEVNLQELGEILSDRSRTNSLGPRWSEEA